MRPSKISTKNQHLGIRIEKNLIKKNDIFSKFQKMYDDVKATQSIFLGMNFGGAAGLAGWLAWVAGWLAGWLACRLKFIDLIVKVIME